MFEIVTLAGRLRVTAPTPEFDTAISFAVPVKPVTRFVALSLTCEAVIEIVEFAAAVKRPCASTVNVPTVPAPPYEPPVTAVLSRFNVIVSTDAADDERNGDCDDGEVGGLRMEDGGRRLEDG